MPGDPADLRHVESAARVAGSFVDNVLPHVPLALASLGAAALRLATYAGPARPWGAVLLDCVVMGTVAYGVSEMAMGVTNNLHTAIASGIMSGLFGWEAVKRAAFVKINKELDTK